MIQVCSPSWSCLLSLLFVLFCHFFCPTCCFAVDITEDGRIRQRKPETNYEGKVLPCDILLIHGSCVVNEAMLTGESIPKVKESINKDDLSENGMIGVDITKSSRWIRHLLLGGTLIQQHNNNPFEQQSQLQHIPPSPDNGCLGIVLRTGFATTQGELMRKILFATEGTSTGSSSSKETFSFIAILVLFALFAAGAVLKEGIYDEKRNKFRLVLHCIMIITSVVPPELPMELSLAVRLILCRAAIVSKLLLVVSFLLCCSLSSSFVHPVGD
jgi:cation-transporting ATPase 13A1